MYFDVPITMAQLLNSLGYNELRPNQKAVVLKFSEGQKRTCVPSNWKWELTTL